MPKKETMQEAGYAYDHYCGNGHHVLREVATGKREVWYANKNHASYGIKWRGTHLEFGYSLGNDEHVCNTK